MDIIDAIKERKSIRGYKPEPVPKEILEEILQIASYAPSAMNTQPWEFYVLTGEVLENIKHSNIEMLRRGVVSFPEHHVVEKTFEGEYRRRQVELAKQIFEAMGIAREDKEKRKEWIERGFRFFDAPCAIIICVDKLLGDKEPLIDIGTVLQTICLTALNYGLGTCIEDQGVMYPEVLQKFANIPSSKRIIISIAIGYPNWDFPANKIKSKREPVESFINWCGYETLKVQE